MLKNKIKTKVTLFLLCTFIIFIPLISNATIPVLEESGAVFEDINETANGMGYKIEDPKDMDTLGIEFTKLIVQYILGFLGVIFLVLVIIGGYQWMTAGGNEESITKAKKRIINATIGIVIVLGAYIITDFIFMSIITAPRPN